MSYRGVGSYYEIPQPMAGLGMVQQARAYNRYVSPMARRGFTPQPEPPGMPVSYRGFGSIAQDFSAEQVWADVQLGGSCYNPGGPCAGSEGMAAAACQAAAGKCNAAGARATQMIRAALNELGYGPLTMGSVAWSQSNPGAAWASFLADFNMAPGPGLGVSKDGLVLMEQLLKEGKKPGPGAAQEYDKKGSSYIPSTTSKASIAGMSGATLVLAAIVVGGIGYAAYRSGKKRKGAGASRTASF